MSLSTQEMEPLCTCRAGSIFRDSSPAWSLVPPPSSLSMSLDAEVPIWTCSQGVPCLGTEEGTQLMAGKQATHFVPPASCGLRLQALLSSSIQWGDAFATWAPQGRMEEQEEPSCPHKGLPGDNRNYLQALLWSGLRGA